MGRDGGPDRCKIRWSPCGELGILREVKQRTGQPQGGHHAHLQRLSGHRPDRGRRARQARRAGRRGRGSPPACRPLDHRLDGDEAEAKLHASWLRPHPAGAGRLVMRLIKRRGRPGGLPALRVVQHRRHLQSARTACKALYKCLDCQEPLDYFKPSRLTRRPHPCRLFRIPRPHRQARRPEAAGAVAIALAIPDEAKDSFAFEPGRLAPARHRQWPGRAPQLLHQQPAQPPGRPGRAGDRHPPQSGAAFSNWPPSP